MPWDMAIPRRIRSLRKALELTQEEFGERLGLTGYRVSDVETGRTVPTAFLLAAIREAFEVDADWLLTGSGSPGVGKPEQGDQIDHEETGPDDPVNVETHTWHSCKACGGRLPSGPEPSAPYKRGPLECPHCKTHLHLPPWRMPIV